MVVGMMRKAVVSLGMVGMACGGCLGALFEGDVMCIYILGMLGIGNS